MKNNNIILFSSGVSEKNGLLFQIKIALEKSGYSCSYWRNLFKYAKDPSNIALLPNLIKKIPTFDYAVLICEGHDKTIMLRNGQQFEVNSMRDNVLFEIGLCSMALGVSRTILLTDSLVHLPEDLTGKNGALAIKQIIHKNDIQESVEKIDAYIKESGTTLLPVVIGAASSSAEGYANNFVMRTLEHIEDGIIINEEKYNFPLEKVFVHIVIPENITPGIAKRAAAILSKYKTGVVPTARSRSAVFKCTICGDELHIYDFPTSIVTSYNTAQIILNMDADDLTDEDAGVRFTLKELCLFEATLKTLLSKEYLTYIIKSNYTELSEDQQKCMIQKISDVFQNRLFIEYQNY